jgi:hypothetical protein
MYILFQHPNNLFFRSHRSTSRLRRLGNLMGCHVPEIAPSDNGGFSASLTREDGHQMEHEEVQYFLYHTF